MDFILALIFVFDEYEIVNTSDSHTLFVVEEVENDLCLTYTLLKTETVKQ